MKNKIKVLGIILLAGFSFFYTDKVTSIIKDNDPIMKRINESKKDIYVSKIDSIVINDEYITGLNGCIVDEENSYNKMKNVGEFKEELLVMKEDEIKEYDDKYIIGGNEEKRKVSIILLNNYPELNNYLKSNKIKINYFFNGEYIKDNLDSLIDLSKYSKIYNYGRNNSYSSKYIVYDNSVISLNFNNESIYCLFNEKQDKELKLCKSYNMKSIKGDFIKENILSYTKENLENGKIFIYDIDNTIDIKMSIKYILSKGYEIVYLDNLLDSKNNCN